MDLCLYVGTCVCLRSSVDRSFSIQMFLGAMDLLNTFLVKDFLGCTVYIWFTANLSCSLSPWILIGAGGIFAIATKTWKFCLAVTEVSP